MNATTPMLRPATPRHRLMAVLALCAVWVSLSWPASANVIEPVRVPDSWEGVEVYELTGLIYTLHPSNITSEGSGIAAFNPNIVLSCSHVFYSFNGHDFQWPGLSGWINKWNAIDRPSLSDDMTPLRGSFSSTSYASLYVEAVGAHGKTSDQAFSRDFAVYWSYQQTAGGDYASVYSNGESELKSDRVKLITGYPNMNWPIDPEVRINSYMYYIIPFFESFTTVQNNYLKVNGYTSYSGNSGGPVWVQVGGADEWVVAGIVVSRFDTGDAIGAIAIGTDEWEVINSIASEITGPPDFIVESIALSTITPKPGEEIQATIVIKNQGEAGGILWDVAIWQDKPDIPDSNDSSYNFISRTNFPSPSPGQTITIPYTFSASGAGTKTFRVSIDHYGYGRDEINKDNNQGTAVYTVADALLVTPSSLDYGQVAIGSHKTLNVTVKNNQVSGNISGNASVASPFSIQSGASYSLAPGQEQTIAVRFTPASAGAANAVMSLTGGGGAAIALSGTGYNSAQSYDLAINPALNVPTQANRNSSFTVSSISVQNVGQHTASGSVYVRLYNPSGVMIDQKGPFATGNVPPTHVVSIPNTSLSTGSQEGNHEVRVSVDTHQGDENPANNVQTRSIWVGTRPNTRAWELVHNTWWLDWGNLPTASPNFGDYRLYISGGNSNNGRLVCRLQTSGGSNIGNQFNLDREQFTTRDNNQAFIYYDSFGFMGPSAWFSMIVLGFMIDTVTVDPYEQTVRRGEIAEYLIGGGLNIGSANISDFRHLWDGETIRTRFSTEKVGNNLKMKIATAGLNPGTYRWMTSVRIGSKDYAVENRLTVTPALDLSVALDCPGNATIGDEVGIKVNLNESGGYTINATLFATVTGPGGYVRQFDPQVVNFSGSRQVIIPWDTAGLPEGAYSVNVTGHAEGDLNPANNSAQCQIVLAPPVIPQHALTVIVEGSGTVDTIPDGAEYPEGTFVELRANAAPGWVFVSWQGTQDDTWQGLTNHVLMDGPKTVTAVFEVVPIWTLVVQQPEGVGSTEPAIGEYTHGVGNNAQVTAHPAFGWVLSHWLVDGENAGDANPITITSAQHGQTRTIKAVFSQPQVASAANVHITGNWHVGATLTGHYTFTGGTDLSTFRWLRANTPDGEYAAIDGATGLTYTTTPADTGKYIAFEVTPIDENGPGEPVASAPAGPVVVPATAVDVFITGRPIVGETLTGEYTFTGGSDLSTFRWLRADAPDGEYIAIEGATGQTYTTTPADVGKYIKFEVTPTDENGPGEPVTSAPFGPISVLGDFNGDGVISGLDIPGFKQALADPDGWAAANPGRPHPNILGDFNGDGVFSGLDIPGFKQALAGGGIVPVTWVTIENNPGFSGQMSRYETTNAQFAQYLNAALASGDVVVDGDMVKGASGNNPGTDYVGQPYYQLDGPGYTAVGATNGGKSRIVYANGAFSVEAGFDNHPVTYVSWYGAMAFAIYYGWRLPTEDEWQAVASFNSAYTYGSGSALHDDVKFLANYRANGSDDDAPNNLPYHPHVQNGTTPVGYFGTFGYGMADMSGNVWEWTSTFSGSYRSIRGGGWLNYGGTCAVSYRYSHSPDIMSGRYGFRVCR